MEVFAKRGTFNLDKIIFEYQPLKVEDWERVRYVGLWRKEGNKEKEGGKGMGRT